MLERCLHHLVGGERIGRAGYEKITDMSGHVVHGLAQPYTLS